MNDLALSGIKHLSQLVSSGLLVLLGVFVMFFSLSATHVQQTQAASSALPTDSVPAYEWWFDPQMPGSFPYMIERCGDQWERLTVEQTQQPLWLLVTAQERLQAVQYALDNNEEDRAAHTLLKGVGYVYAAVDACRQSDQDCQPWQEELAHVINDFTDVAERMQHQAHSPAVRSQAEQVHALVRAW